MSSSGGTNLFNMRVEEAEFEQAGSPVELELSLPAVVGDQEIEGAEGMMSRLDSNLELGEVPLAGLGRGRDSAAGVTALASNQQRTTKASGAARAKEEPVAGNRKRRVSSPVDPAYKSLKRDEYIWPRPTNDRTRAPRTRTRKGRKYCSSRN